MTTSTATRYEVVRGREITAWGLSHRHAVQQVREAAETWLAGQEPLRAGWPGYRRIVEDELAEHGQLHMWEEGVGGNRDAHVATWRIREDGGVATHPIWPFFAPMTTTPVR